MAAGSDVTGPPHERFDEVPTPEAPDTPTLPADERRP